MDQAPKIFADEVSLLVSMGFEEKISSWALQQTNGNIEEAIMLAAQRNAILFDDYAQDLEIDSGHEHFQKLKMVIVIRKDLAMSPGKVASQCVHAALGACRSASEELLQAWRSQGEPVICLQIPTDSELETIITLATNEQLTSFVVCDAGRTEIEAGSRTVCAIGPGNEEKINNVTGTLKLY